MMQKLVPIASLTKNHVAPHFNSSDIRNAIVPLTECDADTCTNFIT